jgi:hypothetical protein
VAPFNVTPRQRFQGSSRGLGITDSAGWPQGTLRLRGVTVNIDSAIQLAPAGTALGAAVFPSEAQLPVPIGDRIHLLVGNQLSGEPAFEVEFLDPSGHIAASQQVALPPSWDGTIHDIERAHLPLANVALIVRTAESRARGGGSPQLFIYHQAFDRPANTHSLRIRAVRGAPLVLGIAGSQ